MNEWILWDYPRKKEEWEKLRKELSDIVNKNNLKGEVQTSNLKFLIKITWIKMSLPSKILFFHLKKK